MAMYELDGNHLLPVRLGRSADAETRARSLAAVQRQVVEVLHRPLFPLEWGRITGGESLTALDATGQVVLVEVLESLSAAEVMAAMARLTATAALGRRELAGRYTGGLVSFREDWNEFREAMPAQVEAGPRLTLITASLAPEVRSSLSVLVGSGVELYEVDVRVVDEARVVVVVEQIVDGSLGAEGPLLVARAPRPSLTGPGTRSGEPAPEPKIEPVTGPIEIVMPRRSQDAARAGDAPAPGRGARRTAGGRSGDSGRGTAAPGRGPQSAPGRSGSAASSESAQSSRTSLSRTSERAAQGTRSGAGGPSSRQARPEIPGASPAEGPRRGSAAGRRAHAAVSARRDTVVRRGVHASEAGDAADTAAEAGGAASSGPEAGAGESRHESATAPSAASAAGAARSGARHTAAPSASSAPAAASRQAPSTGAAGASGASIPASDPWSAEQDRGTTRDGAPRRATGSAPRGAARAAGSTRAARRGGAAGDPGAASAQSAASAGSAWAATGGQQEASASPLPRIAAREAADLAAIASSFERSQRIIWQGLRRGIYHEAVLSSAGIITLADGRTFTDPTSAANAAQGVADADGWRVWRLGLRGPQLGELRDRLPRSGS